MLITVQVRVTDELLKLANESDNKISSRADAAKWAIDYLLDMSFASSDGERLLSRTGSEFYIVQEPLLSESVKESMDLALGRAEVADTVEESRKELAHYRALQRIVNELG